MRIFGKVRHRPSASWRQATDRAFTLIGDGRYEDAGALLTRAADLEPWLSESWFNLALLHKFRHDWEQARAAGLRAVALLDRETGRARLVERRHRRHRPPGLAAGPPGLAGVRAEGARPRGSPAGGGSRSAWTWAAPPCGCRPRARPRWSGAAGWTRPGWRCCRSRCRPPGGAGARSCCTTASRTASGPPPAGPSLPGLRRDRAVGALAGADLGGAAGGGHRGRPGRPGAAGRRRGLRRRGLVLLRAAAVPDVLGERGCPATRATASTWTRTTTASRATPGRWGTARPGRFPVGARSASAASRRRAGLVRGLLDGWVADSPDTREWRDLEEVC